MTALVNQITLKAISTQSYIELSITLGSVVVLLVIILLSEDSSARAFARASATEWIQAIDTLLPPLIMAFVQILLLRIFYLFK